MRSMPRGLRLALLPALVALFALSASAQESDVRKYAVDARVAPGQNAADVRATFTLANLGNAPKRQLQFRINGGAEIRSVTVGGQSASPTTREDTRFKGLKLVSVDLPSAVPAGATADVTVDYRLTVAEAAPDAFIGADETILLPSSVWVPIVNTQFAPFGLNTAPFTVTSTSAGARAVSSDQPLNSIPFLIAGRYAAPVTRQAGGVALEAWIGEGASADARAGADRLLDEASKIAEIYTRLLGPAPERATFRIIASDRAAGFADVSGVALGSHAFERAFVDAESYELLADALARVWIEGASPIRGSTPGGRESRQSGVGLLRDALPRYLAVAAIGERFGEPQAAVAYNRMRAALSGLGTLAASVQLGLALPSDAAYFGLMRAKGPLALRLFEREVGSDALFAGLRTAIAGGRQKGALTLADVRAQLSKAAGRDLSPLFATWIDTVVEPDIIIGVPQQANGVWQSALRNLGTGDVSFDVVATTASGKKVTTRASLASEGFGEVRFETSEPVTTVEADPEKIIPQSNYSNDARPERQSTNDAFAEAIGLVRRREFAPAESKLRAIVAERPADAEAKAWLARALAGLGRGDEAERVARDALSAAPVPLDAAAWAYVVIGRAELAAGKRAEAVASLRSAVAAAVESSAVLAARDALVEAERSGGAPAIDPSIAKFFEEYDRAISAGVNTSQAAQFVDAARLPDFVKGLVTALPRKWTTEILRTEVSGDDAVVDARFVVTAQTRTSARVVVGLRRSGASWKIVDVQALETT